MHLYSRGRLAIVSGVSIALTVTILSALGFLQMPNSDTGNDQPTVVRLETEPTVPDPYPVRNDNGLSDDERVNIRVYQELNDAVVNINTETLGLTWFLEPVPQDGGTGSGSIIDKSGYVLTNYHVVKNAFKVFLTLASGEQFEGKVVGKDPENDLAVVKFDPGDIELTVIPFGRSDGIQVGQKVLAIGNPFAFERTLTTGIISGLGRPIRSGSYVIREMIQTDASINPGNSGGPLINTSGQMIGVNTMIYSPSGGSVGIGFAVPVDTAVRVVPDLIEFGLVRRGWIDVKPIQLDANIIRYASLDVSAGIMVSEAIPGGAADKAGIRGGDRSKGVRYGRSIIYLGGDIIVGLDGVPVNSLSDLFGALEGSKPGETVTVDVVRGRQNLQLQIELSERPESISLD